MASNNWKVKLKDIEMDLTISKTAGCNVNLNILEDLQHDSAYIRWFNGVTFVCWGPLIFGPIYYNPLSLLGQLTPSLV